MNFTQFLEKQWKLILGLAGVCLILGIAFVLVSTKATNKEKRAQEAYFSIEEKLVELKNKAAGVPDVNKDPKEKDNTKPAPEAVDFSSVKEGFEKVINEFPDSNAAQMSAIHLAKLLDDEKKTDEALVVLQKVENKSTGLINTLVQKQIGQLLADKDKCQDAIAVWQKILDRKEASFIHAESKIQQALCYTKLNDLKKAEEILTNLANQSVNAEIGNTSSSKEAEKYLRLIQFKRASGS